MSEEEKLDEIKQILQDACDRDWEDESLFATASIAANGLYWRGKEIEKLRVDRTRLIAALLGLTHESHKPRHPSLEQWIKMDVGGIRALLRELGEAA